MCRIKPFDTPIEDYSDPRPRVTEKVMNQCTECLSPGYLEKEMCVHGAMVDGGLDL